MRYTLDRVELFGLLAILLWYLVSDFFGDCVIELSTPSAERWCSRQVVADAVHPTHWRKVSLF